MEAHDYILISVIMILAIIAVGYLFKNRGKSCCSKGCSHCKKMCSCCKKNK